MEDKIKRDDFNIATDEVLEDIKKLDEFFDKEYMNIEIYSVIKKKMIERLCDISEYYD